MRMPNIGHYGTPLAPPTSGQSQKLVAPRATQAPGMRSRRYRAAAVYGNLGGSTLGTSLLSALRKATRSAISEKLRS